MITRRLAGSHAASAQPEPLDRRRCFGHVPLEVIEATEVVGELLGHVATRFAAAVRRQVLPEQRVQHVAGQVEREVLLELVDRVEVVAVAGGGQLVERGVGTLHVGGVVLVVVQLHDLAADVRLERAVVVLEVREDVDLSAHAIVLLSSQTGIYLLSTRRSDGSPVRVARRRYVSPRRGRSYREDST